MQELQAVESRGLSRRDSRVVRRVTYAGLKRAVDIVLASLLLLLFGPLMVLVALGIRWHSPGPILFRQVRIGKSGKPFMMLKFRSMHVGSTSQLHREHVRRLIKENSRPEDLGQESLKLKADPRITGLGKILRALSLDELPQLFNVLRGEMSLVGPRPPIPYEVELYQDWHKRRFEVLPGITGLWQVEGRNRTSFDDMIRMDLDYIQRMSPGLDLLIILKTPIEMLRGKGAK